MVVVVSNNSSKNGGYSYDLFAITYDLYTCISQEAKLILKIVYHRDLAVFPGKITK